jgi:hypothetical protein
MIVYISIGNSDDKLTQAEWSEFYRRVDAAVRGGAVHGAWVSGSASAWQNACWCIEFEPTAMVVTRAGDECTRLEALRAGLARLAGEYNQDSIAWAVADTEFIQASKVSPP